jgi:hypothetical protein
MMVFLDGLVMKKPEIAIPAVQNKVDANGELTDAATRELIGKQLEAFAAFVARHG